MIPFLLTLLSMAIVGIAFLLLRIAAHRKRISELAAENQRLAKYLVIEDAEAKAAEILAAAKERLDQAGAEADQITAAARDKSKTQLNEAGFKLDSATARAKQIIADADKRAAEIAGSAYEAMNKAAEYERTVKALRNVIDGYGDEYLIPPASLLDDLAEDFGHTQAGQELKLAREHTKAMIRNGSAAACDYVENKRRETAVRFVVDAFNGKVDSILSRSKHDNAGKLEQEIRDAFALVNLNGSAFRDARITEEYLNARLNELRWASIAQQLKLEEREEQQRIKERIREEEKARREFERAMKDAAKEQDMLRKAMEKAQQQMSQASAEQREKYEQQLAELAEKLRLAEEKNQRALSMAQQTKRGHVYIISNIGSFGEHVYKIGLTRRLEPLDRVRELGDSSVPFSFDVHAMIFSEDAPSLENQLHKHFVLLQMNKVNHRKEFFRVDLAHIRQEIEELGISAKWTMLAEATEYRESLAIDKAIQDNPALREAWINRQYELELSDDNELDEVSAAI